MVVILSHLPITLLGNKLDPDINSLYLTAGITINCPVNAGKKPVNYLTLINGWSEYGAVFLLDVTQCLYNSAGEVPQPRCQV